MTIREMVRDLQREVRDTPDLQPDRAAVVLNQLTALGGNISDEVRASRNAYATVHLALLKEHEAASRAKLYAEVTPEYQRWKEATDTQELAKQLTISLRQFLRTKSDEARHLT